MPKQKKRSQNQNQKTNSPQFQYYRQCRTCPAAPTENKGDGESASNPVKQPQYGVGNTLRNVRVKLNKAEAFPFDETRAIALSAALTWHQVRKKRKGSKETK